MEDIFARIVFGHLVGDYLLQNKSMALKKSEKGFNSIFWCTLHCLIYTTSMCLFLRTLNPLVIFSIFITHWLIDRWSLASKWLKLIRGRNFLEAYLSGNEIDVAFSCLVYAVVDNTIHLLPIWFVVNISQSVL